MGRDPRPRAAGTLLIERRYRHPGTGEEAVLSAKTITPQGGRKVWFAIQVARPDGKGTVPGIMYSSWVQSQAEGGDAWEFLQRCTLSSR
jgi:hypothetical protein